MDFTYALTPFLTWLSAGVTKFIINSIKTKELAFSLVGYGGFPSNHSAIVGSMATLIAMKEGIEHPAFGVSVTLAFIVMLDANSLRGQVGKHALAINKLAAEVPDVQTLRERVGHTRLEITAGIGFGIAIASAVNAIWT